VIDLHCHILPGVDDGALDVHDSLAMARQAQADGIQTVCATPHIRHDHPVAIEEIAARVDALQAEVDANGIDVRIVPGGELAQTEVDRLNDDQLRAVSLGGAGGRAGGWVLLEPAPGPLADGLNAVVDGLARRGMRAVIAHPERHAGADFVERLRGLAHAGCLVQWTAEFIAQAPAGEYVMGLAQEGLVHVLGSDAHSSHGGRPVHLAAGFASLARVRSQEQMAWTMQTAPEAMVRGDRTLSVPAE
jgi:protein-tyrosine phosphatase